MRAGLQRMAGCAQWDSSTVKPACLDSILSANLVPLATLGGPRTVPISLSG
jgi:hypothetical protein